MVAAGVFIAAVLIFLLLRSSSEGRVDLSYWFGVCGFKQRFGLPCPGCGWTHAAEMFASGRFIQAFMTQPAAAFFCFVFSLAAVFALHSAVFGISSQFLRCRFRSRGGVALIVAACVVILAGWSVNLVRTIFEN